MSGEQGWRIGDDAGDYFGHQQKRAQLADRRPVIRAASDLVGPGINRSAVRLDDLNALLATVNGFFAAEEGTPNAPTSDEAFIGQVISDAGLGGAQTFVGLETGHEYQRLFLRHPYDDEFLTYGSWVRLYRDEPYVPPSTAFWTGSATGLATSTPGWVTHTQVPTAAHTTDVSNAHYTPVAGGMQFNKAGRYHVEAVATFGTTADGQRIGFGFFTQNNTGSIFPLVSAGGVPLNGPVISPGGTSTQYLAASATVRVPTAGARIIMQHYFGNGTSRTVTPGHLTVDRLGD